MCAAVRVCVCCSEGMCVCCSEGMCVCCRVRLFVAKGCLVCDMLLSSSRYEAP